MITYFLLISIRTLVRILYKTTSGNIIRHSKNLIDVSLKCFLFLIGFNKHSIQKLMSGITMRIKDLIGFFNCSYVSKGF